MGNIEWRTIIGLRTARVAARLKGSRLKQSREEGRLGFRLHQAVQRFWDNPGNIGGFMAEFGTAFRVGVAFAWAEGAAECGVRSDELTQEEKNAREEFIANNMGYLPGFADAIQKAATTGAGGSLDSMLSRAELWANRYDAARVRAAAMACADKKKAWRLGKTKEHCESCLRFDGRVYRYSVWLANDAVPKSGALCCGGFRCECGLEDTDERCTPGPFPKSALCG